MANQTSALISRLILCADTAGDLMSSQVLSIRAKATVVEAIAMFADKGVSAAPVIDEAGQPIGVISRTDILLHEREMGVTTSVAERECATRVADIMTPAVFSVHEDVPASRVIDELVALNVHRVFVIDAHGLLVGVITAKDVLKRLMPG
jgi:CBS-domain-containing membrane protein